jgi:hypothetical protein
MKFLITGFVGLLTISSAVAQTVTGADLLVDLDKYVGHSVLLNDANVYGADQNGALATSHGVDLRISVKGIDKETFRHILQNCNDLVSGPACKLLSLMVMPTGARYAGGLVLENVSLAKPPAAKVESQAAPVFFDLDKSVGRSIRLNDAKVFGASQNGAIVESRGVTFKLIPKGIDKETFRYILQNCSGGVCYLSLVVTLTGTREFGRPVLINASLAESPAAAPTR